MAGWPPVGKIAAHSAYEVFSWYVCLVVGLVFSHLGFWSGSLFLIAPFPDLCLLVLFLEKIEAVLSIFMRCIPLLIIENFPDNRRL